MLREIYERIPEIEKIRDATDEVKKATEHLNKGRIAAGVALVTTVINPVAGVVMATEVLRQSNLSEKHLRKAEKLQSPQNP